MRRTYHFFATTCLLILLNLPAFGQTCDVFLESNGLVVIETESVPTKASWSLQNTLAGATGNGYYEWKTGDPSGGIDAAGQGILSYPVEITQAGTYRFLFRTAAPHTTEHNDAWGRFPDNPAEARKSNGGSVVDLIQNNWFKVYQNQGKDKWNFDARTVDNNPHEIFALISSPGVYRVELSGRSTQFKVDRLVLFSENVSEATATDINNMESGCSSLPVELTSFEGMVDSGEVVLSWSTASELNNAGFEVEFTPDAAGTFTRVGFVAGNGTTNEAVDYRFAHTPAGFAGRTVQYRLKQLDFDGTFEYSDVIAVSLPAATTMALHPAYPNPFNPVTTLSFTLPVESHVRLSVYDASGRLVQELIDGVQPAGYHSAHLEVNASMSSGLYFYRLSTPAQTLTGVVTLLK